MTRGWTRACVVVVWGCVAASAAHGEEIVGRETLNATLWMQRAPEFRALAKQVYGWAEQRIAAPGAGSAALEQREVPEEVLARMPTAVVLDLDETVLDNTVYQARLLRDGENFDPRTWEEWVAEGKAGAIPGARKFIETARRLGHTVFYLSNRDCSSPPPTAVDPCPAKTASLRNLVALGIEPQADPARMLLRGERPEWNRSSKSGRRAFIGANYRIVALVGDDLGDFVDPQEYAGDRARLESRFGSGWFLLPNPIYGSWTRPYDTVEKKYAGLVTADPVLELAGGGPWNADAKRVRVATWNIEYLLTPETHRALSGNCAEDGGLVGGDDRTLPCAITRREPRDADDYAALRKYAAELGADIVALQEVDGPEAAALVFPGYEFCFSTRAHPQKNGFAIRRGLPFRCENEYEPLSLDNAVRRGVVATFFPGTRQEFRLMSVHLKSGCPAGPLTAEGRNCDLLSRQVAPLKAWIESEARAGHRFGVIGDFNRRFSVEKGPRRDAGGRLMNVFGELNDVPLREAKLTDVTLRQRFLPCVPGSPYKEYIDTLLLGRELSSSVIRKSLVRVTFNPEDARQHWLSDHCPVGIELRLQ